MEQDFDLFDFVHSQSAEPPQKSTAVTAATNAEKNNAAMSIDNNDNTTPAQTENIVIKSDTDCTSTAPTPLTKAELRQAAMAFLASLKPVGIAANVPTRRSKYKVAAAGFWRPPTARKTNVITKTAVVVMYNDIDCCFSDCAGRDERIAAITALQEQKSALEARIRETEPHLAATDDLFGEFPTWDYSATVNPDYRKICRKLEKELRALTKGSKLDYIRKAGNADMCFLAVPENLVDPAVIPAEWGVVELTANPRGFKLLRNAQMIPEVTADGRLQLALNIATAAALSACFANGVDSDGKMRRPPKRRSR